jgi:hypothetical protein
MSRDVFVSYSQPDRVHALEIVSQLEAYGNTVWVTPRDIAPSADWAAAIIDAISACKIMVLVFSSASNDSPQVHREVERAIHHQRPILTVRIEDALPTGSMEYFLSSQHWLDAFPPPVTAHYERLCRQVSALLKTQKIPEMVVGTSADLARRAVFTAEQLESLQSRLAHHVGPVAAVLVKRAAARAASWSELTSQLAAEIDPAPARQAFLDGCHSATGAAPGEAQGFE